MDNLDFLGDEDSPAEGMPSAEDRFDDGDAARQDGYVPLQAMVDERAKRQAWEQHAAELQAQLDAVDYDAADEPHGSEARMAGLVERQESLMLDASERMAAMAHGAEVTEAAKQWALHQPPEFRQAIRAQNDPYDYLVRLFRRERIADHISEAGDFDDYLQWKSARAQVEPHSPYHRPVAPPRSQATTPSATSGRRPYLSDEDAFDGAFARRK